MRNLELSTKEKATNWKILNFKWKILSNANLISWIQKIDWDKRKKSSWVKAEAKLKADEVDGDKIKDKYWTLIRKILLSKDCFLIIIR